MKKEKQKICPICNKKLTFLKATLKDGVKVCSKHVVTEAGLFLREEISQSTVEDIKEKARLRKEMNEETLKKVSDFQTTKKIGSIQFNDIDKKILIQDNSQICFIDYGDVISFEMIEDDETITSGGLGRAAVGGVLFGGAGAVVGAVTGKKSKGICNSMKIKLTVDNIDQPAVYVSFIDKKTKTDSTAYDVASYEAQECLSVLQLICNR